MSSYRLPLSSLAGSILLATSAHAAQSTSSTETMVVTASGHEQAEITAPAVSA